LSAGSTYKSVTTANALKVNTRIHNINTVHKRVIVFMSLASMKLQEGMLSILYELIVTGV
jgi:putative effector of murein hydrolase